MYKIDDEWKTHFVAITSVSFIVWRPVARSSFCVKSNGTGGTGSGGGHQILYPLLWIRERLCQRKTWAKTFLLYRDVNNVIELRTTKNGDIRHLLIFRLFVIVTRLEEDTGADCRDSAAIIMPTAAVLGAAVGVGGALFLTLTLLIYRYHAAQKKEAADQHYPYHQGGKGAGYNSLSNSWSTRDSWAPPPSPTPPPYKTSNCSLIDEGHGAHNGKRRPLAKFYLPLTTHHQVRDPFHDSISFSLCASATMLPSPFAFLNFAGFFFSLSCETYLYSHR